MEEDNNSAQPEYDYVEEEDESEEIPEDYEQEQQEIVTENPFGFLFSSSVTQCFAKEPVTPDHIVFFSGNEFSGEMHEGIIHGQGKYTWTDLGASYTGSFNWGSLSGTGRIEWKDGSSYEGGVLNGIRNGQGIYRCAQPKPFVYEGGWENGQFHGEGTCWYGEQGCNHHYVGEFQHGQREGKGTMYYPTGNIYEGEWHLGKRHGQGKFTWAESGSYYVGEFKDGEISGKGEIVYAFSAQSPSVQFVQSNRYLGEFDHSQRNGDGTFYYANGAVYKGEWHDNRKNGKGTYTSRDGRVYHSEFRDGSIYQDGKLFVPTPSISLNFSLDGLLAPSESGDEVMNSLCNIYVRFLPKLRALYQQYSRIQWADDKTITALRMVGMWRFLQDKGSILEPTFRLTDADDIIQWNLEKQSKIDETNLLTETPELLRSTISFEDKVEISSFRNDPLKEAPDPFATLFLYQLFEALVRLAHHRLKESFPDSLILQVTRFLENTIFVDDAEPLNQWSIFRKSVSIATFDDVMTKFSPQLLQLYLDFSGYSSGTCPFQCRQLEAGLTIETNVDATVKDYQGLMKVRDLILFLGDRGFFDDAEQLTAMDVLLFLRFGSVSREVEEEEEEQFRKFFTLSMHDQITFVEFVQSIAYISSKLITFDWEIEMKFTYVIEHINSWVPPPPEEKPENEEEEELGEAPPQA